MGKTRSIISANIDTNLVRELQMKTKGTRSRIIERAIRAYLNGERIAQGAQLRQERMQMTTEDTIRDMVNDPMITITEEMLPIINDPGILMDMNGVLVENQFAQQFRRDELLSSKKKRKVSKYQKELGRQLKMLKKKHPRTPITKLMRKAHAATRRALK